MGAEGGPQRPASSLQCSRVVPHSSQHGPHRPLSARALGPADAAVASRSHAKDLWQQPRAFRPQYKVSKFVPNGKLAAVIFCFCPKAESAHQRGC